MNFMDWGRLDHQMRSKFFRTLANLHWLFIHENNKPIERRKKKEEDEEELMKVSLILAIFLPTKKHHHTPPSNIEPGPFLSDHAPTSLPHCTPTTSRWTWRRRTTQPFTPHLLWCALTHNLSPNPPSYFEKKKKTKQNDIWYKELI